jgi:opacity protein-like surface antigen
MRWLHTYAITIYGLAMLSIAAAGIAANLTYDAGTAGFLFHVFFAYLFPVLGFMFYWPEALLHNVILSGIVGLSFCGGIDYIRFRFRTRQKQKRDNCAV